MPTGGNVIKNLMREIEKESVKRQEKIRQMSLLESKGAVKLEKDAA